MIDWTKPIVIAATDWQEELPCEVVTEAANSVEVKVLHNHKIRADDTEKLPTTWYFEKDTGLWCGHGGYPYVCVINKVNAAVTEEKIMTNSFVVGQKYFSRDGVEYMFLADARDGGYTGSDPLIFVRQNNGATVRRTPEGKGQVRGEGGDILLSRKSVAFLREGESTFTNLGKGHCTLSTAVNSTSTPTWPVVEMKRQGNEMVFVKMHYPEDAPCPTLEDTP